MDARADTITRAAQTATKSSPGADKNGAPRVGAEFGDVSIERAAPYDYIVTSLGQRRVAATTGEQHRQTGTVRPALPVSSQPPTVLFAATH